MQDFPVRLFNKSVLKQTKYREIIRFLGSTEDLHCLDIGSDNGVVSYLLRERGGSWKSADLDPLTVRSIRDLVTTDVYQIDGLTTPFNTDEFDRIIIVDMLEHIPHDDLFLREMFRILKPGGILILNVPHLKNSLLRRFRIAIGQTDKKHGHLRPGYTVASIQKLLGDEFEPQVVKTYSKFFSELIDTSIVFAVSLLQKGSQTSQSKKGLLVTRTDLDKNKSFFRAYSLVYPVVWLFSKLDYLLFFRSGYMLIASARSQKQTAQNSTGGSDYQHSKLDLALSNRRG